MRNRTTPYPTRPLIAFLLSFLSLAALLGHFWNRFEPSASAATTFTVNSTGDGADNNLADGLCNDGSGNCTLRAAIEQANATTGLDTINFIIDSGIKTITPATDLPTITDPVIIDGTTQPGFSGSPIIEINGSNRPNTNQAGFLIMAGSSTIKGLVINRVNSVAIGIVSNGGNRIEGNFIGTDVTGNMRLANSVALSINTPLNTVGGTTAAARNVISGNGSGIELNGTEATDNVIQGNFIGLNAAGTDDLGNSEIGIRLTGSGNRIGGTDAGAGNVISGNGLDGVQVGGQMNTIQGNLIGTNATGTAAIPNSDRGIRIFSSNHIIGGTSAAARNVISGNFAAGISIEESSATGNVVQGNFIGTDISGTAPLPNSPEGFGVPNTSGGIFINRGNNNLIGGSAAGAANTIAFNGGAGVRVVTFPNTSIGVGNRISRNKIFGNLILGIDLGPNGVTPNDQGDSDTDANNLQNFPVITAVNTAGGNTMVSGTLASAPNTSYELEFFSNLGCHASGHGEGARFLGMGTVVTNANGNASFNLNLPSALSAGEVVTATATDPSGNTSEFSQCNFTGATGIVQFAATSIRVREDLSILSIPVRRVGGSNGPLSVNFATADDTARAGQDYTQTSGTLMFADGETSQTIMLPIINDMVAEPSSETLFVRLSNPATPEVVGASGIVVVRIFDPNNAAVLSFNGVSKTEGDTGTSSAAITVSLSMAIGQTVTVNFETLAMTATSGVDFQQVSSQLTFPPGVTSQIVIVSIIGDRVDEFDETFTLRLFNAINAAIMVSSNPPVTLIVDDDLLPSILINDVGVIEGSSGTTQAIFTVHLSARSEKQVSVNFATADGSATAPPDYMSSSGTVNFNAGEISKTATVLVNGDMMDEPLETFLVNLSSPQNATLSDAQGIGSIANTTSAAVHFASAMFNGLESSHFAEINVTRSGNTSAAITVDFRTFDGTATERSDYTSAIGSLSFAAGETSKTFTVLLNEDAFQEGNETVNLMLNSPTGGAFVLGPSTVVLVVGDTTMSLINPVDEAQFFVRQHYHDFLNREPDAAGLAFWVNEITSCGMDAQCIEIKRINVSAAFFLSIEFQETGFLVYRMFKTAYGDTNSPNVTVMVPIIRLNEFLPDAQRIGQGVQVGIGDWEAQLEANKNAYAREFVSRQRFLTDYPLTMTAEEFVDKLNMNAGGVLSQAERDQLVAELNAAGDVTTKRASVVRKVAEDADLKQQENNRAFVLMQYYGYLRRNPDDPQDNDFRGWEFWLTKLNQFNGNFVQAEMVKAFISSIEYRQRFGP